MIKCPFCDSDSWKVGTTGSGYRCYKCKSCGRKFNERAATPFHWLHFSNKDIMMALMLCVSCGLSSGKVAEVLDFNGVKVSARSIRRWPQRFRPLMMELSKRYRIELSKASSSELRKRGKVEWSHKVALLDSEGGVVASYLAHERVAREVERALAREKRLLPTPRI